MLNYFTITSLLENDMYKFNMGQVSFTQYAGTLVKWRYKCRNEGVTFTPEMHDEINAQIDHYCSLSFSDRELRALAEKAPWLSESYLSYLRLWRPLRDQIHCELRQDHTLNLWAEGPWCQTIYYEVPLLAIVNEVYYRYHYSEAEYVGLEKSLYDRLAVKIADLGSDKFVLGPFSEFGMRRRFSAVTQAAVVKAFALAQKAGKLGASTFVGTSNVYLAVKLGTKAIGTIAHEAIEVIGQGDPSLNPAFSNRFMMKAWHKEFGLKNGIYLTDCIGTDVCLLDLDDTECRMWDGFRHDSGDPYAWGERMLAHLAAHHTDPSGKTLLFSDCLDFQRASDLYAYFKSRVKVAFGIGTFIANDTDAEPLNQVMKVIEVNGRPVAKLADVAGKTMCEDAAYVDYLKRSIQWRLSHTK
jgi:nicotinate phosphoribosyltransferase